MGNFASSTHANHGQNEDLDYWWTSSSPPRPPPLPPNPVKISYIHGEPFRDQIDQRQKKRSEMDNEFQLELEKIREKRRQIISGKRKEMQDLRDEVERLKEENLLLRSESAVGECKQENLELKKQVAEMQFDLQNLNTEAAAFETQKQDYQTHLTALKDVINVSKQMLMIRETQLKELRGKVKEIEASLAGREFSALSQDLRKEYEKQLQNIRNLRIYYEERQRADVREKEELRRKLEDANKELEEEREKHKELSETISRLEDENSSKYDEIKNLESNLGLTKAECRQFQSELSVINQLFSQILLGFNNTQEIDIDKLIKLLEENHHILKEIAINEESSQVSALPKVLLDLVTEMNRKKEEIEETANEPEDNDDIEDKSIAGLHQLNSASEIAENLPKVWKVLIELLSHQSPALATTVVEEAEKTENPYCKVVETPKGPHLALSVSKTFIRLKDLILEKKSLERETSHLKHLNTHLEGRLQDQEKRLELVTHELAETWHVVGKLQKKHQLLHTQEKILRYELAQKRKLLTQLKEELEYSREKWQEAREKNSTTEKQWKELRTEFAARKTGTGDDFNNSVESGYSDDKECSSEDEPGYETDISESQKLDETDASPVDEELPDLPEVHPLVEDEPAQDSNIEPIASGCSAQPNKSLEEVLAARDERLKRLEGQAEILVQQVTSTSTRSVEIANKLDTLHEIYGEGRNPEASGSSSAEAPEDSNQEEESN